MTLWSYFDRVAQKRMRGVPRDCTAVWAMDQCMEDFNRASPPEPLMHQVCCETPITTLFLLMKKGSKCPYTIVTNSIKTDY